jgi:hypothetical protein
MDDLNRQGAINPPGDTPDYEHEHEELDDDFIEAYCVVCRHMVVMSNAEAVWTSRGTPGTRGVCPDCGTTVFRMGKTHAHDKLVRPAAIRVEGGVKVATGSGRKRAQPATYINYASPDSEFAQKLADDLEKAGIHTWIDAHQNTPGDVKWAGGVHPALKDSVKMVVVLSATAKDAEGVTKAWSFFRDQKRPVMVALVEPIEVPDALRRCPRFDFSQDYIAAFRQLLSALGD